MRRPLDLDDLGAEVGHDRGRRRTGDVGPAVDDPDSGEKIRLAQSRGMILGRFRLRNKGLLPQAFR